MGHHQATCAVEACLRQQNIVLVGAIEKQFGPGCDVERSVMVAAALKSNASRVDHHCRQGCVAVALVVQRYCEACLAGSLILADLSCVVEDASRLTDQRVVALDHEIAAETVADSGGIRQGNRPTG